ncbi:MAG: MMPL family transporter [Alphaproteobacteria bacterium]|nr:MMPL family transporter [Alphaproteobacteria bacterium]
MSEPSPEPIGPLGRIAERLVAQIVARPWTTLVLAALFAGLALFAAAQRLGINTDTTDFVTSDEPFLKDHQAFEEAFPQLSQTTLVVVTAREPARAKEAADELAERLKAEPERYNSVFEPGNHAFFDRHALLYLDEPQLQRLLARLAEAQPALAVLARDPNMRGIDAFLDLAVTAYETGGTLPPLIVELMRSLADEATDVSNGEEAGVPWFERLLQRELGQSTHLILVQGRLDFATAVPGRALIDGIRGAARDLGFSRDTGVEVRLTGRVPLETEELQSAKDSVTVAGFVSLALLTLLMFVGVRSLRLILAALVALFVGLAWTLGFAALTVGQLNILSVAFAVLFIGIGVDFMIHYALRVQEEVGASGLAPALTGGAAHVARPILLCGLTTAIGFLAFVPTEYSALGELGIISAGGILFAVIAAFTVVPALLALTGLKPPPSLPAAAARPLARVNSFAMSRPAGVLAFVGLVAVGAAIYSRHLVFDFSSLALKDPHSESVTTLRDLQDQGISTDFTARVLAKDAADAEVLRKRLLVLPTVKDVVGLDAIVPRRQDEKRAELEEALFFLWPALSQAKEGAGAPLDDALRRALLEGLAGKLRKVTEPDDPTRQAAFVEAHRLAAALAAVASEPAKARELEARLVGGLAERLDWLKKALQPSPVVIEEVPDELKERVLTPDGRVLLTVLPKEDIRDIAAAERFIRDVHSVDPHATGRPVAEAGVGAVVERSLFRAFGLAAGAIFLLLLVSLRSLKDSLLVMAPLVAATALTTGTAVVFGIHLNFANVILLPLIFGLGVDGGIHMVTRYKDRHSVGGMMRSSTPRAIVLSVLTTLFSFGSLMLSSHAGIASMGLMLTIAAFYLLVTTLLMLPALLVITHGDRPGAAVA